MISFYYLGIISRPKEFEIYSFKNRLKFIMNPFPSGRKVVSSTDWEKLKWQRYAGLATVFLLFFRVLLSSIAYSLAIYRPDILIR